MNRRGGISTLVVTMLLLFFTVVLGLSFGTGLQDRVSGYLAAVEGELVSSTMVYRNDMLHVRADFRHVMGSGLDRVAVSEMLAGDAYVERDNTPLGADHTTLAYAAGGWVLPNGTSCSPWTINVVSWPAVWPPGTPPPCTMDIYQRLGGGSTTSLDGGDTAVLEFVVVGVGAPSGANAGLSVEYGYGGSTKITNVADAALYVTP